MSKKGPVLIRLVFLSFHFALDCVLLELTAVLGISDGIRLVRDCQVPMRGCRLTDATIELELDADGFTLSEV